MNAIFSVQSYKKKQNNWFSDDFFVILRNKECIYTNESYKELLYHCTYRPW